MLPCSRSQAEQYIEGGWVRVNGRVVESPQELLTNEMSYSLMSACSTACR
jgi:23S rRNA pseudouridine2604 synthase